jgi:hypothetical protein
MVLPVRAATKFTGQKFLIQASETTGHEKCRSFCGAGIYSPSFHAETFNPWAGLKTDSRSAAGPSVPD